MNNLPPAITTLMRLLRINPTQARALMPGSDDSPVGFPGALITPDDDSESWAAREYKRDVEEFQRGYRNNG